MPEEANSARTAPRAPITLLRQYWSDEGTRREYLDQLFDGTAGDYDFVENLVGLGTGPWYRRSALARHGLRSGMHVLDVATGTGLVAREAVKLIGPEGRLVGLDPSAGMLQQASGLNLPLVRAIGEKLPFRDASFDFVSMGFAMRHVADLDGLFSEFRRVLRPGGTACILELTAPERKWIAAPLRFFMTSLVPVIAAPWRRREQARALMQFWWDTSEACVRPEAILAAMERGGLGSTRRNTALGMFSEYTGQRR